MHKKIVHSDMHCLLWNVCCSDLEHHNPGKLVY